MSIKHSTHPSSRRPQDPSQPLLLSVCVGQDLVETAPTIFLSLPSIWCHILPVQGWLKKWRLWCCCLFSNELQLCSAMLRTQVFMLAKQVLSQLGDLPSLFFLPPFLYYCLLYLVGFYGKIAKFSHFLLFTCYGCFLYSYHGN